jgi:hypothetical protein
MRKLLHPQNIPPESHIEEHLLLSLRRLTSQIIVVRGSDVVKGTVLIKGDLSIPPNRPITSTEIFASTLHRENFHIPSRFSDLNEARSMLEEVLHFGIPTYRPELVLERSDGPLPSDFQAAQKLFSRSRAVISTAPETVKAQLAQWTAAMEPLYSYSQTLAGESTFVSAAILRIQAIVIGLTLCRTSESGHSGFFSKDDTLGIVAFAPSQYSSHSGKGDATVAEVQESITRMKEILKLCGKLVVHPRFTKSFVCGLGIIPPLWCILKMSPERELKVEAVRLLREMVPRVEGIWNSKAVAEAGELELKASDSQRVGVA